MKFSPLFGVIQSVRMVQKNALIPKKSGRKHLFPWYHLDSRANPRALISRITAGSRAALPFQAACSGATFAHPARGLSPSCPLSADAGKGLLLSVKAISYLII